MQRNSTRISVPVLILAAICCVLTANRSLRADTIYSVQFENNHGQAHPAVNFSGVEPDAAAADSMLGTNFNHSNVWNHLGAELVQSGAFSSSLTDSTGAGAAQLNISNINGAFNKLSTLPDTYFYSNSNSSFTISGLERDSAFTLFLYAYNNVPFQEEVFTAGNSTFDSASGAPSSLDPNNVTTGHVTGVTSSTGSITGTWNFGPNNEQGEKIDWAGFQLDVASSGASLPEPATLALLGTGLLVLAGAAWRRLLS